MDIFAELAEMQRRILANDWSAFEKHYETICHAANPSAAKQIASADLGYYSDRKFGAYCKALKKAQSAHAPAIYFEYDLDNEWQSSFFICNEYAEPEAGDDDWACDFDTSVRASSIPEFAEIYDSTDKFCCSPEATAITLFLIARTTAALRAVVSRKLPGTVRICIGFHDQNPIHRL